MKKYFSFRVTVFTNGKHSFSCLAHPPEINKLCLVFNTYPTISELNWFRGLVNAEINTGRRSNNIGLNNLSVFVEGDKIDIGYDIGEVNYSSISTEIVMEFIDECIKFHEKYNAGEIPGIIPEGKLKSWSCVPNEYIKEEYWEKYNKKKTE